MHVNVMFGEAFLMRVLLPNVIAFIYQNNFTHIFSLLNPLCATNFHCDESSAGTYLHSISCMTSTLSKLRIVALHLLLMALPHSRLHVLTYIRKYIQSLMCLLYNYFVLCGAEISMGMLIRIRCHIHSSLFSGSAMLRSWGQPQSVSERGCVHVRRIFVGVRIIRAVSIKYLPHFLTHVHTYIHIFEYLCHTENRNISHNCLVETFRAKLIHFSDYRKIIK